MSMLNRREDKRMLEPKLPRAPTVSPLQWDEEALRRHQRDVERERQIEALESDRDQWRRDCISAQQDAKRLEALLAQERTEHGAALDKLNVELDSWKWEYAEIWNHMMCGAKIFNEMLNYKDRMKRRLEQKGSDTLDKIEQLAHDAVASAVSKPLAENEPPLPRVVTVGPIDPDNKE